MITHQNIVYCKLCYYLSQKYNYAIYGLIYNVVEMRKTHIYSGFKTLKTYSDSKKYFANVLWEAV
jgi:hypothetical protein